ncbi:MAG: electron transfer flavoprotein subunit alpha [Halanaeroarchaeum sp.]
MTLRLAVTVKVVPKPEEVELDEETMTLDRESADSQFNPADKNALEMALSVADGVEDAEVYVVSMGPPFFESFLQDAIAMGADDAVLLSDPAFAGADTYPTSRVLASGIEKLGAVDVVFSGEESADSSTGQVPPGIAEWLDVSQVTYANSVAITDDRLEAERSVKGGVETVRVPLPSVVSVEYGVNDPRFPDFAAKRRAEREWEATVWDQADLDLPEEALGDEGSRTTVMGLETVDAPDRRQEWIEGSTDEQGAELATIVMDEMEG